MSLTSPSTWTSRVVRSGDLRLSVREYGDPTAAVHAVLVHGYPDDQRLWEDLVAQLPELHVVTYDVRGAGGSSVPGRTRDYRNALLVDDLVAVVEATVPAGEQFLLVGHDWGSIQLWDAVVDPRLEKRVSTFVSASGPSVDHVGAAMRGRPPRGLAGQLLHSFYIGLFQLPWLPERVWGSQHRLTPAVLRLLADQEGEAEWTPTLAHNAANGVNLYRANMGPKLLRPRPPHVTVPVLVVFATQDTFVGSPYVDTIAAHCDDLRHVDVDAPHWHPRSRPELLAGILREHLGLDA